MLKLIASAFLVLFAVTVWETSANAMGECSGQPAMDHRKGTSCDNR